MGEVKDEYDYLVLGTGLTEAALSGILSTKRHKVLHVDRNTFYGGETATVSLEYLFKKYGNYPKDQEPWTKYGKNREWMVDLLPKFIMAHGDLRRMLVAAGATRDYPEIGQVAGSYVQQKSGADAKIAKVPDGPVEALRSPLMGLFEKRRAKKFLEWIATYKKDDPSTYGGLKDIANGSMRQIYKYFGLEPDTTVFLGHGMALYQNDDYIDKPGGIEEFAERVRLYANSMARHGSSPYLYPHYGLSEISQFFSRLSAVHGGLTMLRTDLDEVQPKDGKLEVKITLTDPEGVLESASYTTKVKKIFADPSFFPSKVNVTAHLLRAICVLNHPIAQTDNADSCQVIIPANQVGRKNDVYIGMVSNAQAVCPRGYYIAIVSTIAETGANHHLELQPGLERLGKIEEVFTGPPIPIYAPIGNGREDQIYISKSYDAATHFEAATADISDIWQRAFEEELDLGEFKVDMED